MASSSSNFNDEKISLNLIYPAVAEYLRYNPTFELPKRFESPYLEAMTNYKMKRMRTVYLRRNHTIFNHDKFERQLRLAATVANTELLVSLLRRGISPNCVDQHKRSSLHLAASRGYLDVVMVLLCHGANPDLQDSLGNTPLHLSACSATTSKYNEVCKILLKHGARVDIVDRSGRTPEDLVRSKLNLIRTHGKEDMDVTRELTNLCTTLIICRENNERKMEKSINSLGDHFEKLTTTEVVTETQKILTQIEKLNIE